MSGAPTIDFRYAPATSWTCIGLQDDPFKTLVREDGALLYQFQRREFEKGWAFELVIEPGIQAARGPHTIEQTTETPRFPCVITRLRYARAELELRAFAHQDGDRRTDVVLWRLSANPGAGDVLTGLKLDVYHPSRIVQARSSSPGRVIFAVDRAAAPPTGDDNFTGEVAMPLADDSHLPAIGEVAFVSTQPLVAASATGFRPCSGLASEPHLLSDGAVLTGALIIPLNGGDVAGLDLAWAQRAYAEARAYWERLTIMRLPIRVPDPDVMAMLEACARNILQAREIEHGLPVFKVGPTVYRSLFVVDGNFLLEAAMYLGLQDDAYRAVDTLLRRVRPDGSISEMPFHAKETAISLFTLVRMCLLMGDEARLRGLWPVIMRGVAAIERLRQAAAELPAEHPCHGLMPPSYADGGIGGKRGEYTTPLWTLAGLRSVARIAATLGFADDAAHVQRLFDRLMADLRLHAARDQRRMPDGSTVLPMWKPASGDHTWITTYPGSAPVHQRLTPASGTWAFCQAIHPGEVFAPDDPLVRDLLALHDRIDDEEGLPVGTGWLPYQSLWTYHGAFAAQAWLYAGRPDKAVDYLYAIANHAAPTRVWREEQSLTATGHGQVFGDMPHNWASAEFIRLIRHLLVFEVGGGLDLLPGVPPAWRAAGSELGLERTPTAYGPVSLALATDAAGRFTLHVERDLAWPRQPGHVRLYLPASDVVLQGAAVATTSAWLALPPAAVVTVEGRWS